MVASSAAGRRPQPVRRRIRAARAPASALPGVSAAASERRGRGARPRSRPRTCAQSKDAERDADVGALRRQQGDGRHPRLRLERGEPHEADQPELHRPHGDGGQDRPGHRLGRRPGPDGHGPDLRPAVRERRPAGRHHGPDEGLAGARGRQPGPQDRRHVQRPPVRRPAVRRRVGAVLQQGPVHEGRARSRTSRRPASPRSGRTPTRSPRSAAASRATTCPATAPAATSSPSAR